jgi:hypothetical protein
MFSAHEHTLASLDSKIEDFQQYKRRLSLVRDEKEKRELKSIGIYFSKTT